MVFSVNVDGIKYKVTSFKTMLTVLNPDVFMVQGTKLVEIGFLKIDGYDIFEKVRKDKGGGGIAIGVRPSLEPTWVNEGYKATETLSVVINVEKRKIRMCVGYGPQNVASDEVKNKFWEYLSNDVSEAKANNEEYFLEMDSNSWVGGSLLPNDPRAQNNNGLRLENFLKENSDLILGNAINKCKGLITRSRFKDGKLEQSVIDHVVVSDNLEKDIESILIDEKGLHKIVSYKKDASATESDHNGILTTLR